MEQRHTVRGQYLSFTVDSRKSKLQTVAAAVAVLARDQTRVASNLAKAVPEKLRRRRQTVLVEKNAALERLLARYTGDGQALPFLQGAVNIHVEA